MISVKRIFGDFTLEDALQMVPADRFDAWRPDAEPRPPSATLLEHLKRLKGFETRSSPAGRETIIDALLLEVVSNYPCLQVWKDTVLDCDAVGGVTDYLITPPYMAAKSPLLCLVHPPRCSFLDGTTDCIAQMVACRANNRQAEREIDAYGIVSDGQRWQFFRLTPTDRIYESPVYVLHPLSQLLSALHHVFTACAANVSQPESSRTTN